MQLSIPVASGVEASVKRQLRSMGYGECPALQGRIALEGDWQDVARLNVSLRSGERVLLVLAQFYAPDFDTLFENVSKIAWEEFFTPHTKILMDGKCRESALMAVKVTGGVIKKAIVERLRRKLGVSELDERGERAVVNFEIYRDNATISLDTSGDGLHKRGYRRNSNSAPIKETLAAAMCALARIYPDTQMYDPFCGSGTLLIESALMAANIAPGLRRFFAAERFGFIPESVWREERTRAQDLILHNVDFRAHGSDIDKAAAELTLENARRAGVLKYVSAKAGDIHNFSLPEERCLTVTNPPYGERLLDVKAAEELYAVMGNRFNPGYGRKYFIISPDDEFERFFGRTADKRRKLYNGMLKCQLYMYFKNNN